MLFIFFNNGEIISDGEDRVLGRDLKIRFSARKWVI
jgi:hypothetical protein